MRTVAQPAPPAEARPFVAASRKRRLTPTRLLQTAAWLDAEPWASRPLPEGRHGLVVGVQGLRLHLGGARPVLWHPGFTVRRLALGAHDALRRALDLQPGDRVLDGTLGMGHDALVLAAGGAWVEALEVEAIVAAYTLDGVSRFAPSLARRIGVRRADHRRWLPAQPADSADHVYLDPMFPARSTQPSTLGAFRALPKQGHRPDGALIDAARRIARRRVVLKLAPDETLPVGARSIGSRRVRFAVWGP